MDPSGLNKDEHKERKEAMEIQRYEALAYHWLSDSCNSCLKTSMDSNLGVAISTMKVWLYLRDGKYCFNP